MFSVFRLYQGSFNKFVVYPPADVQQIFRIFCLHLYEASSNFKKSISWIECNGIKKFESFVVHPHADTQQKFQNICIRMNSNGIIYHFRTCGQKSKHMIYYSMALMLYKRQTYKYVSLKFFYSFWMAAEIAFCSKGILSCTLLHNASEYYILKITWLI